MYRSTGQQSPVPKLGLPVTITAQGIQGYIEAGAGGLEGKIFIKFLLPYIARFSIFVFERFIKIAFHSTESKAVWTTLAAIQEDGELHD